MARDPGEWYAEQREKAQRLEAELAATQRALAIMERALGQVRAMVKELRRAAEAARYVGD